jgi:hypothetical protein
MHIEQARSGGDVALLFLQHALDVLPFKPFYRDG